MIQSETQETADSLFAITTLAGEADRFFYPVCKCVLDVSVSTLLLVLLSPLLILLAILIKPSLDELPQLINVIRRDMSLVGPRPAPSYELAHYQKAHYERLAALPGITGVWQVHGRCRVRFEEMMRMDIDYVRRCSFWLDLNILLLTIPAVISGRGAE